MSRGFYIWPPRLWGKHPEDFYEEDEPVEKIREAFHRVEPFFTTPNTITATNPSWSTMGLTSATSPNNVVIKNNVFTGPGDRSRRIKNGWWIRREGDIWRLRRDT